MAATFLVAGCASSGGGERITTGEIPGSRSIDPAYAVAAEDRVSQARPQDDAAYNAAAFAQRAAEIAMKEGQHHGAAAHLSRLAEARPDDKAVAYNLARHLRYIGALSQAEQALNDVRAIHPRDQLLRLELAKVKIAGGFPAEAVDLLEPLRDELPDDPAVLQALGVAYDRQERHREAQALYAAAMRGGRPSAALLNNDGLSRMMSGDLTGAIDRLRRASTAPGATAQVRKNLALALTLNGEDAEARRVAEAAGPDTAEPALAYFGSIAGSQDAWSVAKERE